MPWEDTVTWLTDELSTMRIARDYPEILTTAVRVLEKWRASFPKSVWIRVVKAGRLAKELNECAPVIRHTLDKVAAMPTPTAPNAVRTSWICAVGSGTLVCSWRRCSTRPRCSA